MYATALHYLHTFSGWVSPARRTRAFCLLYTLSLRRVARHEPKVASPFLHVFNGLSTSVGGYCSPLLTQYSLYAEKTLVCTAQRVHELTSCCAHCIDLWGVEPLLCVHYSDFLSLLSQAPGGMPQCPAGQPEDRGGAPTHCVHSGDTYTMALFGSSSARLFPELLERSRGPLPSRVLLLSSLLGRSCSCSSQWSQEGLF